MGILVSETLMHVSTTLTQQASTGYLSMALTTYRCLMKAGSMASRLLEIRVVEARYAQQR